MEKNKLDQVKKIVIVLIVVVIVLYIAFFFNRLQHESDPCVYFNEVPQNATINHTVIHLFDKDFQNQQGWEIIQNNGKITYIYFRDRHTADQSFYGFMDKYGNYNSTYLKYVKFNEHYYRITGARP